jgi:hypothetical protein
MPKFGGYSPFPKRMGGGRPRVETLTKALAADRGDGFDALNRETIAYTIDTAIARALSAAWGTNQRLAQLWDPRRMSEDILARWEKILALTPLADETVASRRDRVEAILARFGQPAWASEITTKLQAEIGDAFVALETISFDNANILVPDGTYPWGAPGGVPWSSTVAHILIRLQKPTGWSEGDFYDAAAKVVLVLDPLLPAWVTFSWYRAPDTGVAVDVAGGPSAGGFYLDDEHNLDNNVFDV